MSVIDPFGWEGTAADPWLQNAPGALSINLWRTGEAPELLVRYSTTVNTGGSNHFGGLSAARPMGVRDDLNLNNEYVEVSRDPQFVPATLDIGGSTIRTRTGAVDTTPAGTTLIAQTRRFASSAVTEQARRPRSTWAGPRRRSTMFASDREGEPSAVWCACCSCIGVYHAAGAVRNQLGLGTNGCR